MKNEREKYSIDTYSCSARRRYIVVILFISQFDAMSAGAGHAAQRTFTVQAKENTGQYSCQSNY